jgi:hypothetical protein
MQAFLNECILTRMARDNKALLLTNRTLMMLHGQAAATTAATTGITTP